MAPQSHPEWQCFAFLDPGRFLQYLQTNGKYDLQVKAIDLRTQRLGITYDVRKEGQQVATLCVMKDLSDRLEETAELTFTSSYALPWGAPAGRMLRLTRGESESAHYVEQREFHDGERIYGGVAQHFPFDTLLKPEAELFVRGCAGRRM